MVFRPRNYAVGENQVNEQDFEDACAMLAMVGIIIRGNILSNKADDAKEAFAMAKHMSAVRNQEPEAEAGITTVKPRKRVAK